MVNPVSEVSKRIRRAQIVFAIVVLGGYAGFLFVFKNRQQAAMMLETKVAAVTVQELMERREQHWLAQLHSLGADFFRQLPAPLPNYHYAIYERNARRLALPLNFDSGETLPTDIWQAIVEKEEIWSGMLPIGRNEFAVAIAPLKDIEQWEVVGAVLVAQRAEHVGWRSTAGSFAGWVALFAAVAILVFGYIASRQKTAWSNFL